MIFRPIGLFQWTAADPNAAMFVFDGEGDVVVRNVEITNIYASPSDDTWYAVGSVDGGDNYGWTFLEGVAIFVAPDGGPQWLFEYLDLENTLVWYYGKWNAGSESIDRGNNWYWIFGDSPVVGTGTGGTTVDAYPMIGYVSVHIDSCIFVGGF